MKSKITKNNLMINTVAEKVDFLRLRNNFPILRNVIVYLETIEWISNLIVQRLSYMQFLRRKLFYCRNYFQWMELIFREIYLAPVRTQFWPIDSMKTFVTLNGHLESYTVLHGLILKFFSFPVFVNIISCFQVTIWTYRGFRPVIIRSESSR